MGNSVSRVVCCFVPRDHQDAAVATLFSDPLDEGLGHSFCYIRPVQDLPDEEAQLEDRSIELPVESQPDQHHHHPPVQLLEHLQREDSDTTRATTTTATTTTTLSCIPETSFKSISGASVSANTAAPRSIVYNDATFFAQSETRAATFESTSSFTALPLQPIPRGISFSGPVSFSGPLLNSLSGPLERGFLSGPIERGFMSGPLDRHPGSFSGPFDRANFSAPLVYMRKRRRSMARVIRKMSEPVKKALTRTVSNLTSNRSVVAPMKSFATSRETNASSKSDGRRDLRSYLDSPQSNGGDFSDLDGGLETHNLHWAQGKAGEDRVHVVLSEEHGWLFVGIYDGFSGPDATDFLMRNLYPNIYAELKGLLWDQKRAFQLPPRYPRSTLNMLHANGGVTAAPEETTRAGRVSDYDAEIRRWVEVGEVVDLRTSGCNGVENVRPVVNMRSLSNRFRKVYSRRRRQQRRIYQCRFEWEQERMMAEQRREEQRQKQINTRRGAVNHAAVLKALGRALEATEESYLEMIDEMFAENPEVALMGSCVLVMLIKDDDVYVMNVGDSRAVLAQHRKAVDMESLRQRSQDAGSLELERIVEETPTEIAEAHSFRTEDDEYDSVPPPVSATLGALQLSRDHSTKVLEEAMRIISAHPDDSASIQNDRVKGKLAVTRAFGAGYLKQPRWNDALLEVFRINFVGNSPYISCVPHLHHHKLGPQDQFLVLSSDGLYQYLTNEEVVSHVEWFMEKFPDGDPAQYLIEVVLFRAAKKAGMEFHDLLDIPQGDRRKYHDDLSVMVVSLEGRIWRSSSQGGNR